MSTRNARPAAWPRALMGAGIRAEGGPSGLIKDLHEAFDDFKARNNDRVGALERDLATGLAAMRVNGGQLHAALPTDPDYSRAFAAFFRTGEAEGEVRAANKTGSRASIQASMSVGSTQDGGYLAPVEWDRKINQALVAVSPMRRLANVQQTAVGSYSTIWNMLGLGSGWVGETAARPATTTPQLMPLDYIPGELYANPYASQQLLEDSEIDIVTWLANEVETEFARQEGIAFLSGDGVNKPTGILTYVTGAANAAKHPFGPIVSIASGAAGGYTTDGFVSMVYDLPAMWTPNAKFYMNRRATSLVRKLKDGQGNYIWQPSFVSDQPQTIMGYPVMDTPDMPDVGAGSVAALFGDMRQTYIVVDRVGISVLRDPYTNKPFVGFYTRKRVGGGVTNPQSMRAMTIAAS